MLHIANRDDKLLQNLSFALSPTAPTFWVLLFGNAIGNLIQYTASQDVVQRYVTTPTERGAARAIWTNAAMSIPAGIVFFGLGTALYAFYTAHPQRLDPTLGNDAIYPLFMVRELPAGVAGLVVAGIFAAAQPTSNLNSMATAVVTDFYDRFKRGSASDAARLRLAQTMTVFFGVVGTLAALALATFDILSIYDVYLSLVGLSGGVLAGLFALGIFSRRANGAGALIGAALGIVVLYVIQRHTRVSFLLYGAIGIISCFVLGYLASILTGGSRGGAPDGLTIHARAKGDGDTAPTSPEPVAAV
jgi:Na+/proline symporter